MLDGDQNITKYFQNNQIMNKFMLPFNAFKHTYTDIKGHVWRNKF